MSLVYDGAVPSLLVIADQETRNFFDRLLRGRETDALQSMPAPLFRAHRFQPFQRQGQVCAAACADHRVNLVDNHRANGAQHLPAAFGGQQ